MKTEKSILIAFILNLGFCIIELFGGIFTGSMAIISDSMHDFGDSVTIGISFILEKISKRKPDEKFTYGYGRFSDLGALITSTVLIIGSIVIIVASIERLINPEEIKSDKMIIFAVVGVILNLIAALITHKGHSINEKAVSLHMIEDVLGWLAVLVGSVIIRITGFTFIDPVISVCVSAFIMIQASKNTKNLLNVFLDKVPNKIKINDLNNDLMKLEGVHIHHLHIRSINSSNIEGTVHVVSDEQTEQIKSAIKKVFHKYDVEHLTIQFENTNEKCCDTECRGSKQTVHHHHH